MLGLILTIAGLAGVAYQCLIFVRVTLPDNYGKNPGFGCLEMMVMPWFSVTCIGVGLLTQSWLGGAFIFGIGMFSFGFFAILLSRLFGGCK